MLRNVLIIAVLCLIMIGIGFAKEIQIKEIPYNDLLISEQNLRTDDGKRLYVSMQMPENWLPNNCVFECHWLGMGSVCGVPDRPDALYYFIGLGMGTEASIRENVQRYYGNQYSPSTPKVKKYNGITVLIENTSHYDSQNDLNSSSRFIIVKFKGRNFGFILDASVPANSNWYSTVDNDISRLVKTITVKQY